MILSANETLTLAGPPAGHISNRRMLERIGGPRRGLSRDTAAAYVGVSPSKFDELVKDGRMPRPRRIDARNVWDLHELDRYFDALPGGGEEQPNPWDDVLVRL